MPKVGGEVDALCTKCELVLAHTVIAMVGSEPVKVECNTCHGVHRYKSPKVAPQRTGSPKPRATRAPRAAAAAIAFDELLASRKVAEAAPYSPKRTYAVDDVVDHPIFGRGFVSAVRDGGKIEVTFRSDVKVLIHGRS
ncbi:MAG TPA: hypothetical protein VLT61_07935 [Anaeromyxobacteraceae bacterium]|nr:hypothetical protein [Anaeromyxobacteraceae bacterium]